MKPPVIILGEAPMNVPGFSRRLIQFGAQLICAVLILLTTASVVVAIIGVF